MSLSTRLALAATAVAVMASTAGLAAAAQPAPVAATVEGDFAAGRILVKYAPGVDRASQTALERGFGARGAGEIAQLGVRVLEVPQGAEAKVVAAMSRSGKVEYAERDVVVASTDAVTPNDPSWKYQWGARTTRTDLAWSTTKGSSSIRIAILDTGLTPSADFAGKVLPGHNVLTGSSDVTDSAGHGTRAASIAAGATDNGLGVAGYCWSCTILPVKVMTSSGSMSDVARGVVWATDNGADVISMSLGGTSGLTAMQEAVRYASSRGALVVAAAGNSGTTAPFYPAAYPEVIGVAGTDVNDQRYSWSNHGSWVDVAAPGAHKAVSSDGNVWTSTGTSSAAPAVAGIAGLALSLPSQPTAAQVRSALTSSAVDVGDIVQHGRVDAAGLVGQLSGGAPAPAPTTSPTPSPTVAASSSPSASPSPSSSPSPTSSPSATTSPSTAPQPEPSAPTGPELSVSTGKVKGQNVATLSWSGLSGSVTVVRDGLQIATTRGTTYEDRTGSKGAGSADYQVCGTEGCTSAVSATW